MENDLATKFSATPDGILINGVPLSKSQQKLSLLSHRYVERAEALLAKATKDDWGNKVPHTSDNLPLLAKVKMLLALASPQSVVKKNPYHRGTGSGGGQFTTADEAGNSEGITSEDKKNPRFKGMTDTHIKKQKFIDAHLAVTEKAAERLNVPAANILGIAALESKWGLGDFVLDGSTVAESTNSYFGMHAPAPFMDGTTPINNGPSAVAGFSGYQNALDSFVAKYGTMIQGASDPTQFATILQRQGKFGIDPDTGKYLRNYVPNLVSTINHLSDAVDYAKQHPK